MVKALDAMVFSVPVIVVLSFALTASAQEPVRVLEVDKDARRVSLSLKRAVETPPPVATTGAATAPAAAPAKKKKRPELRGGLDF